MTRRPSLPPQWRGKSIKALKRRMAMSGIVDGPVEMSDKDYRKKYPAIMDAWERYQVILNLHKGADDVSNK